MDGKLLQTAELGKHLLSGQYTQKFSVTPGFYYLRIKTADGEKTVKVIAEK